ncbi:MAG TPA: cytochrome c oxidase subunit 3 [Phototrophicaceae bacterium]|nr:cytochrome c oxidase subunit 3 [Phototrophicaceae bacterium]
MSEMSIEHVQVDPRDDAAAARHEAQHADNLKFAMWLYLASEVVIFTTLIAIFVIFRVNFPDRVEEVHQASGLGLVGLNTFLLLTSSWTMVMGLRAIQKNDSKWLARWIGATAVLGTLFVMMQYVEYSHLASEGITLYSDAFGMRFYAPTAFHGAHVIAGVIWAIWVVNGALKGKYKDGKYLGVEIFGLFWHFVDVVWIVLFTVIYLL